MIKRHVLIDYAKIVALSAIFVVLLQTFVTQPFRVDQTSMQNSLQPGEYVMVDKLTPRFMGFSRGDVVVFHPPESWTPRDDEVRYIKRVIGLPGETIAVGPAGLTINGVPIDEPYVYWDDGSGVEEAATWTLGAEELLVFGDHRSSSSDSRAYGSIPTSSVIGRAFVRYFPLDRISVIVPPSYPIAP